MAVPAPVVSMREGYERAAPEPGTDTANVPGMPEPESARERTPRLELITVILLGVVSVVTAWTSFQASLYGGMQASAYSQAQNAQTEAESLYLEANQQYVQDTQTLDRLDEFAIESESSDPAIAELGNAKYEQLYGTSVSAELDAAIQASPDDPQSDEEYQAALFGAYAEEDDRSIALSEEGDAANGNGDKLGLSITIMAISLFLLGIAAVVRGDRVKWVLIGISSVIFVAAVVWAAFVPVVWF